MTGKRLTTIPEEIGIAFSLRGNAVVQVVADGHINDSLIVRDPDRPLLVQRINHEVFTQPHLVQQNIVEVTEHVRRATLREGGDPARAVLEVQRTGSGEALARDAAGDYWRAYRYIENSFTKLRASDPTEAHEVARAFGTFQRRLRDFDATCLHETIPRFHDTPHRLDQLKEAARNDACGRLSEVAPEFDQLLEYEAFTRRLVDVASEVPARVAHNDAKLSNVLLDRDSGDCLCVIDLDTVMPGLSLFDFGEMIRSMGHTTPEDADDLQLVVIRPELWEAIVSGYLTSAGDLLTAIEHDHLFDAAKMMVLENGLRFLADYLRGDTYFRIKEPLQNLRRARAHLALMRSLDSQERELRRLARTVTTTGTMSC